MKVYLFISLINLFLFLPPVFGATVPKYEIGVATDIPVDVHLRGRAFWENGFGFLMGAGFVPSAYVDVINSVSEGFGFYNNETSDLVSASVNNSLSLRFLGSYNFGPKKRIFVRGGYHVMISNGSAESVDVLEAALGREFPGLGGSTDTNLSAIIHSAIFESGYQWPFTDHLSVEFGLGFIKPLASDINVDVVNQGGVVARNLESQTENFLKDIFKNDVWVPKLSLSFSYLF